MNILDINNLPTLTLKVTGRRGNAEQAWVINQEEKSKVIIATDDISYTQGEELVITLTDTDFISSIVEDTTLSVILMGKQIRDGYSSSSDLDAAGIAKESSPLYRDIVKFKGELNSEESYSQYDTESEYYIYEDND